MMGAIQCVAMDAETDSDAAAEYRQTADAIAELRDDLKAADSIADDVPVLADLYHAARTSSADSREGRYVAVIEFSDDGDREMVYGPKFVESGANLKDPTGVVVSAQPWPLMPVERFVEQVDHNLRQAEDGARKNAVRAKERAEGRR